MKRCCFGFSAICSDAYFCPIDCVGLGSRRAIYRVSLSLVPYDDCSALIMIGRARVSCALWFNAVRSRREAIPEVTDIYGGIPRMCS